MQVASCKQTEKDKISRCKNDVRKKVDQCKKKVWIPTGCELRYRPELLKCEPSRINVSLCEVDRLTAVCCEGLRQQARGLCSAGLSVGSIQKQVQSVQAKCSIATGLAKASMKSYLSGQVLVLITQLESVRTLGDTVRVIRKAEEARADFEKWASGLEAVANGEIRDAQKALGSLATQIQPELSKSVSYADAAQAIVTKNVDRLLAKVANAAGDLEAIQTAKQSIAGLRTVANDLKAIQTAAKQCAQVPKNIQPKGFPGWKAVTSEEEVDAAVNAFRGKFEEPLYAAARCQAVVVRVERLLR
jgi:hypothetical protein